MRKIDLEKEATRKVLPNITEVLSLVDHFCFYNIPPHPRIGMEELIRFRDLMNRAIVEVLLEYELRTMDPGEEKLHWIWSSMIF